MRWGIKSSNVNFKSILYLFPLRDACKIKIAHILYFRDRRWGEGGKNRIVSNKPKNERFFVVFRGKNRSFLEVFETKGGGEAGIFNSLNETKYERFLFCKHPVLSFNDSNKLNHILCYLAIFRTFLMF